MDQQRGRLPYVDGARALAALWVVVGHGMFTVYPVHGPHGWVDWAFGWGYYAHFAVTAFLVISGYSLTLRPLQDGGRLRDGVPDFLRRRFRRIVYTYWIALTVALALNATILRADTGTHWDVTHGYRIRSVIAHYLLLQDIRDPFRINHVFWSIALEWHIYVLFPLLLAASRRFGAFAPAAAILIATSGMSWYFFPRTSVLLLQYIVYAGCFAVGVAACWLIQQSDAGSGRALLLASLPIALIVGIAAGTEGASRHVEHWWIYDPLVALTVALLLGSAERGSIVESLLGGRRLAMLGAFAYSIYLIHAPVLQLVWQYGLHPMGFSLNSPLAALVEIIAGGVAGVAVAYVFFLAAERPFLTRRRISPATLQG